MRRPLLIALLGLSVSAITMAAEPKPEKKDSAPAVSSWKTHEDTKNKFKINFPAKWKIELPDAKKSGPNPSLVSFVKPDQTALVSLLRAKSESALPAVDFLNQMDQSRKATNLLPETARKLAADVIKKSNADDGAVGYYEMAGKSPVLQRTLVLKKKKEVFVLTGTFQKAHESDEDPLIESILTSFQFSENH